LTFNTVSSALCLNAAIRNGPSQRIIVLVERCNQRSLSQRREQFQQIDAQQRFLTAIFMAGNRYTELKIALIEFVGRSASRGAGHDFVKNHHRAGTTHLLPQVVLTRPAHPLPRSGTDNGSSPPTHVDSIKPERGSTNSLNFCSGTDIQLVPNSFISMKVPCFCSITSQHNQPAAYSERRGFGA
jgi:hypothetical protein